MIRNSSRVSTSLAVVALFAASLVFPAAPLHAQESPQEILVETKLVADDASDGDNFGSSVAVDGDVMVVAAPWADAGDVETSGAVYLFLRDPASGEWIEHQQLLPANGTFGDNFLDLTLAVDGDTIVVGAPYTTLREFQEGVVYIFEPDSSGSGLWSEVARFSDVTVDFGGHFGISIALEGDLLVVGAAQDSSSRNGWVRIFERDRGGTNQWGQVTTLFHTSVEDAGHPRSFGSDVAIDGDLLVVGASRTSVSWLDKYDGAAYLFRRNQTDRDRWDPVVRLSVPGADQCVNGLTISQFLLEASAEDREAADACADERRVDSGAFGHRVAIQGDTIAVTARFADDEDGTYSVGKAFVFQRDPEDADRWPHVATLSPSLPSPGGYFGSALALAGDTVLVGAPGTTVESRARQGAAFVFERSAGGPDAWGEIEQLRAYDGLGESQFGSGVALDGAIRIVGARGDSHYQGALYLKSPPEEPTGPQFEPTAELVNGGVVEGPNGVLLSAVGTALAEPLPIWIHEVPAPDEPLSEFAVPRGAYYNVGAVKTTVLAEEDTFLLALPVPEGDTAHLAVAVHVAADRVLDGPDAGFLWLPMRGVYDPQTRLFTVTLTSLLEEGSVVVLMEHPDVDSMENPVPEPVSLLKVGDTPTSESPSVRFEAGCYDAGKDESICGEAEILLYERKLKEAYDKFISFGFEKPLLVSKKEGSTTVYHDNWIKRAGTCEDRSGTYYYPGIMVFCYEKGKTADEEVTRQTMHEMFHAFQHGFDEVRELPYMFSKWEWRWIIEGTATAAEGSAASMKRDDSFWPRPVNKSLTYFLRNLDYEAQDFWVHFGAKKGLDVGYLKPALAAGALTEDVAAFFAHDHQTSLGEEYWDWAKNQVMEQPMLFMDNLTEACRIKDFVLRQSPRQSLTYPASDAPPFLEGVLDRLTSDVVEIKFGNWVGPVRVSVDQVANLKYKVYVENERNDEGDLACMSVNENSPRIFTQPPDESVYVLISNIQHEPGALILYTVRVEPANADEGE